MSQWIHIRDVNDEYAIQMLAFGIGGIPPDEAVSPESAEWSLVLSGKFDEGRRSEIEAVVNHLRKLLNDDTLTIAKIRSGSIKLDLRGLRRSFETMAFLFQTDQLFALGGHRILSVSLSRRPIKPGLLLTAAYGRLVKSVSRLWPKLILAPALAAAAYTAYQADSIANNAKSMEAELKKELTQRSQKALRFENLARAVKLAESARTSLDSDWERSLVLATVAGIVDKASESSDVEDALRDAVLNAGRDSVRINLPYVAVPALSLSPDLSSIAVGSRDDTVILWRLQTRRADPALHLVSVPSQIEWNPRRDEIAALLDNHELAIWPPPGNAMVTPGRIDRFTWSPDGENIATIEDNPGDRAVSVLSSRSLAVVARFRTAARRFAWDPSGSILAIANDSTVLLADIRSGAVSHVQWPFSQPVDLAWESPRTLLALDTEGGVHRVPGIAGSEMRATVIGRDENLDELSISPDGRMWGGSDIEGLVRVWLTEVNRPILSEIGTKLAWSPNSRFAAILSDDRRVRIWNAHSHRFSTLAGLRHKTVSVRWRSDGEVIGTADDRGNPVLYKTEALEMARDKLLARARELVRRNLTPSECSEFFAYTTCPNPMNPK